MDEAVQGSARISTSDGSGGWRKSSGSNLRAKIEASIDLYRCVAGDARRSRNDQSEANEVAVAVAALDRMLGLGRLNYVRIA
jgi:hypothetical protein